MVGVPVVGGVVVPVLEDRSGGDIPDSSGRANVGRPVGRFVTEPPHQRVENADPVTREQVDGRAVGGEAYGRIDIGQGALPRRPAKNSAESGADRAMIVRGPGIKNAGVDDGEGARHHGRAELGITDALEGSLVPEQDDAIAGGEDVKRQPTQGGGGRGQGSPLERGPARNPQSFTLGFTGAELADHFGVSARD